MKYELPHLRQRRDIYDDDKYDCISVNTSPQGQAVQESLRGKTVRDVLVQTHFN
jgi:hypothetical protein